MRSFLGRDILSLKDMTRDEDFRIFEVCRRLRPSRATAATPICWPTRRC